MVSQEEVWYTWLEPFSFSLLIIQKLSSLLLSLYLCLFFSVPFDSAFFSGRSRHELDKPIAIKS